MDALPQKNRKYIIDLLGEIKDEDYDMFSRSVDFILGQMKMNKQFLKNVIKGHKKTCGL